MSGPVGGFAVPVTLLFRTVPAATPALTFTWYVRTTDLPAGRFADHDKVLPERVGAATGAPSMVAFSEPGTTAALLRTALRSSVIVRGSQGRPAGVGTGDGVRNGVAGLNRRTGNRISRLGQRETRHGMRRAEIGCRITCCGGSCSPRNQIVVQNFVAAVFDSDGVCDCPLAAGGNVPPTLILSAPFNAAVSPPVAAPTATVPSSMTSAR